VSNSIDSGRQAAQARRLLALHHAAEPLVLVNAWDVASAKIIESLGFPAVATSSAGIANAMGYPDGEAIPPALMIECVARIAAAVSVPVTADLEAGYGATVENAEETARQAIASGSVGLNLEDGTENEAGPLVDAALHAERIRAVRRVADAAGVPLVINGRTDAFLHGQEMSRRRRMEEALSRAAQYRAAGADCIFVPGGLDRDEIAELVRGIDGPINILANERTPPLAELKALGVKRVSLGSAPMAFAMGAFRTAALEVRDLGTFDFAARRIPYGELNDLLR
jgi:2-methylisocitrate lyase-like PEP mutase family enzyme